MYSHGLKIASCGGGSRKRRGMVQHPPSSIILHPRCPSHIELETSPPFWCGKPNTATPKNFVRLRSTVFETKWFDYWQNPEILLILIILIDTSNYWLVVWNIFYFPLCSHILGINHPNWPIFFRGVQTTNQIMLFLDWLRRCDWSIDTFDRSIVATSLEKNMMWACGVLPSPTVGFCSGWWTIIVYPETCTYVCGISLHICHCQYLYDDQTRWILKIIDSYWQFVHWYTYTILYLLPR